MYETKVLCLARYLKKVKSLLKNFDHFEFERISQSENDYIDSFVKLVSMRTSNANRSIMLTPSIKRNEATHVEGKES